MIYKRAWAEINLQNLCHNLKIVQSQLSPDHTGLMGIVKADAYGHGAVAVAHTLEKHGVKNLGVALCEEAIELRNSGMSLPILVMGFTPKELVHKVLELKLTQTIFSKTGADFTAKEAAKSNEQVSVHIKIDTGMSRLGFLPTEKSVMEICEIARNPYINITGIYTHFATSDAIDNQFMHEQLKRFTWVVNQLTARGVHIPLKHISNSGAFSHITTGEKYKDFNLDMVRIGIMLYGYPPSVEMGDICKPLGLKPAMRLISRISMVKELEANVGISYGHIYKTKRKSKIAVLPIGYADGYPRQLSKTGKVIINGQFAPIAGAICMDQCMVDITDIEGEVKPYDEVIMMGEPGICADNLAETIGTISYEILCGIGKRVPRVYV